MEKKKERRQNYTEQWLGHGARGWSVRGSSNQHLYEKTKLFQNRKCENS